MLGAAVIVLCAPAIFQLHLRAAAAEFISAPPQRRYTVRWTAGDTNKAAVEVSGLSQAALQHLQQAKWDLAGWQELLSVYAEPPGSTPGLKLPPMLGAYSIRSDMLRFEPQFPLEPGITYRAIFRSQHLPGESEASDDSITSVFSLPPGKTISTTEVSRIYPSADVLPENLLKFYINFSAPMSGGRIYDHIHLLNDAGKEIEAPFLEIDEELWDPAMTRLTVFIDPGRIKRGVLPLEEVGPALEEGKSYSLVIAREWKDANGNPLRETFKKAFKVGPPDREPPDPARWKIEPPKPGARAPLAIFFPESMDHALARRVIHVMSDSGELIEGETLLEDHERRWTLVPESAWRRGAYKLVIETTLEDLAGNNIGKPFEVDVFDNIQRRLSTSTIKLAFEIR